MPKRKHKPFLELLRERWSEWIMSIMLVGLGVALLLPGDTFSISGAYSAFLEVADEDVWGRLFVIIGLCRVAALGINGAWRRTPTIRLICSSVQLLVWANMAGFFLIGSSEAISTAVIVYGSLALCELGLAFFIVADVRHAERANGYGC